MEGKAYIASTAMPPDDPGDGGGGGGGGANTPETMSPEVLQKEKLLKLLKREVKMMMEESVTLKTVHEDSASVNSLCAMVDTCLSLGLKRRALGLFKTSSTTALVQKLAKENDDAAAVVRKATLMATRDVGHSTSHAIPSLIRRPHSTGDSSSSLNKGSRVLEKTHSGGNITAATRFMWIRVALFEKRLHRVVCYLVQQADRFYTKDSLVADQDYGPILSSLLVGPCALEFTKVKTTCHSWSDLPANELVQRHKISSCGSSTTSLTSPLTGPTATTTTTSTSPSPRPSLSHSSSAVFGGGGGGGMGGSATAGPLGSTGHPGRNLTLNMSLAAMSPQHVKRSASSANTASIANANNSGSVTGSSNSVFHFAFESVQSQRSVPSQAREYVESLHQNQFDNLLYGKNNVQVLPKDSCTPVPGYLSLHQYAPSSFGGGGGGGLTSSYSGCCLKWTPNRLMNGSTIEDKSASWQQAINIDLSTVQFIHCHQAKGTEDEGGTDGGDCTVVLVSVDGTQHQPLQFPAGGHLLQFLSCIESSLLPHGMLDPPLWSEKSKKLEDALKRKHCGQKEEEETGSEAGTKPDDQKPEREAKAAAKPRSIKRFLPSLSRAKTQKAPEVEAAVSQSAEVESSAPAPQRISALERIDTVFKVVYQDGHRPEMPRKDKCGSGAGGGNDVTSAAAPVVPQSAKSRTADWFTNLFSPNKSRNNSSSTDTSRSFSVTTEECRPNRANHDEVNGLEAGCPGGGGSSSQDDETISVVTFDSQTASCKLQLSRASDSQSTTVGHNNEDFIEIQVGRHASGSDKLSLSSHEAAGVTPARRSPSEPISTLCHTMKRQIISRAFYGWLAHCRHLKIVRQHLGGLSLHDGPLMPCPGNHSDSSTTSSVTSDNAWALGLTADYWESAINKTTEDGSGQPLKVDEADIYSRIYFGGIEPHIRRKVWPYLLGHYKWNSTPKELKDLQDRSQRVYENKLSDWMAIEAIIRQRDKEVAAANIANVTKSVMIQQSPCKDKAGGNSSSNQLVRQSTDMSVMSNDVFEEEECDTISSRTVSADKISTITEVTENSTSNSEKTHNSRNKFSGHSDSSGGAPKGQAVDSIITNQVTLKDKSVSEVDNVDRVERKNSLSDDDNTQINKEIEHTNGVVDEEESKQIHVEENGDLTNVKFVKLGSASNSPSRGDGSPAAKSISYRITTPSQDGIRSPQHRGTLSTTPPPSQCKTLGVAPSSPRHSLLHQDPDVNSKDVLESLRQEAVASCQGSSASPASTTCHSPVSSECGGIFPQELIENFSINLHRIDKDVQRCDRNLAFFAIPSNLDKLRNVITTYVWDNLDIGYMQGMCDLVGPLLFVFEDEALTYFCFSNLMTRMISNFPNGNQMDENFANMRSLIQVLDQGLYDTIQQNGDFSHFYFCYRWFLLDFKREFTYSDTFSVWETIWASKRVVSSHFYLFVALALVEFYRDIILDRQMDFTDIIKFFNEMAEKHDADQILTLARNLLAKLQSILSDK